MSQCCDGEARCDSCHDLNDGDAVLGIVESLVGGAEQHDVEEGTDTLADDCTPKL